MDLPFRREWLPTPVLWPGEFHGLHSACGSEELDTSERFSPTQFMRPVN